MRHLKQEELAKIIDFNPRTTCVMRQVEALMNENTEIFQSTHHLRDATANKKQDY